MVDPRDVDFPSTHWTLVGDTCRGTPQERREALEKLLRRYIKPLTAFVSAARRLDRNEAEEVSGNRRRDGALTG